VDAGAGGGQSQCVARGVRRVFGQSGQPRLHECAGLHPQRGRVPGLQPRSPPCPCINKRLNTAYLPKESCVQLRGYRTERGARAFFERWKQSLRGQRYGAIREIRADDRTAQGWHCRALKPDNNVCVGPLEGLNNKIRVIQRSACGYRDEDYL
jgi:Transposase